MQILEGPHCFRKHGQPSLKSVLLMICTSSPWFFKAATILLFAPLLAVLSQHISQGWDSHVNQQNNAQVDVVEAALTTSGVKMAVCLIPA